MIVPQVMLNGFILAGFALTCMSLVAASVGQYKVSAVTEAGSFAFIAASVWVLYHFGTWVPPGLQLGMAVVYSLLAAVWGSGLIDRTRDAFTGSDTDTGFPPAVLVDEDED